MSFRKLLDSDFPFLTIESFPIFLWHEIKIVSYFLWNVEVCFWKVLICALHYSFGVVIIIKNVDLLLPRNDFSSPCVTRNGARAEHSSWEFADGESGGENTQLIDCKLAFKSASIFQWPKKFLILWTIKSCPTFSLLSFHLEKSKSVPFMTATVLNVQRGCTIARFFEVLFLPREERKQNSLKASYIKSLNLTWENSTWTWLQQEMIA